MKKPKAQILQAKYALRQEDTEFLDYYKDDQEELVYCFFGDLEIDGDLLLDWEGYGDAKNFAEGFCARYNIRSGWLITKFNPIIADGKEIEHPLQKAGIVLGDTIHTINGYPVHTTDLAVIFADSPEQAEIEYTHLGELSTAMLQACYVDGKPRISIEGHILDEGESPEEHGICVLGSLKVNGSIVNRMGEGGPMLYVRGNAEADNLIAGGSFVEVKGTTTVKHYVYGHYNDGLMILKDVAARAIISSDHALEFEDCTGPYIDDYPVSECFNPKYADAIDAMLDGADIIMPAEE